MRIAEIDVPKGCDKVYVDVESGILIVSYGSGINKREVYNQYTRHSEELPGMGDLSVMWNDGARECAVIATVEGFAGEKYKANNNHEYGNAIKFRDHQQYLEVRGFMSKINYKERLDRIFSQYIRLRDMIGNTRTFQCISCGKIKPINQADCGHYINRQHMATRFSEMNCNAQCRSCNRFDEGNMQGYRRNLVWKHGENKVLLLESQKYETRKYTEFEYKALIEYYKKEVKRLLQEKGLDIKCLAQ